MYSVSLFYLYSILNCGIIFNVLKLIHIWGFKNSFRKNQRWNCPFFIANGLYSLCFSTSTASIEKFEFEGIHYGKDKVGLLKTRLISKYLPSRTWAWKYEQKVHLYRLCFQFTFSFFKKYPFDALDVNVGHQRCSSNIW